MKKLVLLTFLVSYLNLLFGQSATINYSTSGLSQTLCNVFNTTTQQRINNIKHYPVSGGVKFNGSALVLQTKSGSTLATDLGTAFALEYTFKVGYTYSIKVTAHRTSSDNTSNPHIAFSAFSSLPDPNKTGYSACGPVGKDKWGVMLQNVISGTYVNGSSATYTLPNWSPGIQANYLTVLAWQGSTSATTNVLISSIVIQETPPNIAPELTVSPSSLSIQCGNTMGQTITVNNPNNVQNITSYEWNLGSAVNGWLHNGLDAQQYITTTANSITLTPKCGSTASNIQVTVRVNGANYKTYTIPVSFALPYLSINGAYPMCSSTESYSVSGLPCNATISWSASPSNVVSMTSNGNNATLTALANGEATLSATVTSCGKTVVTRLDLRVGRLTPVESLTIDGVDPTSAAVCRNSEMMLIAHPSVIAEGAQYEWFLPSDWTSLQTGTSTAITQDYMLPVYPGNDGPVYVRRLNECGNSDFYSAFISFDPYCSYYYTISPNPATDNITVDGQKQKKNIKEVQIIDKIGQVRKVAKFGNNVQRVNLNISDLTPDIYYIKIFDGKEWRSKPIRVQ